MTFKERIKGAVIAIGLLIGLMPLAAVTILFCLPLFRWIEAKFNIETIGHSGVAEWVFLVVYCIYVFITIIVWRLLKIKK